MCEFTEAYQEIDSKISNELKEKELTLRKRELAVLRLGFQRKPVSSLIADLGITSRAYHRRSVILQNQIMRLNQLDPNPIKLIRTSVGHEVRDLATRRENNLRWIEALDKYAPIILGIAQDPKEQT